MPDGVIDQIKERIDIVDLISSYLKLQKSGVNFKARCPFHNEKTGSFFVSPERQIWHCFGCGLGGDVFGFVKQIEGVEFPEALKILAGKAGIELKRNDFDPYLHKEETNKQKLYEICDLAAKFFRKQLHYSSQGKAALAYLKDRGLNEASIDGFQLGYAPDSWNALSDFLVQNYELKEIHEAGLAIKKESGGGYYDRFRSRIMFPICDTGGRVIGFTGRIFHPVAERPNAEVALPSAPNALSKVPTGTSSTSQSRDCIINCPAPKGPREGRLGEQYRLPAGRQGHWDGTTVKSATGCCNLPRLKADIDPPLNKSSRKNVTGSTRGISTEDNIGHWDAKYINTPQTLIYDKSRVLYGLDRARMDIRRNNNCLVVEGNMDVIMSHQAGVTNAVACSGTAFTPLHLKIIKRYTDNLNLCFDSDSAGINAMERGLDSALASGFNVGIIFIDEPDLKDPADYVKKHGSGWAELTKTARPFLDFLIHFLKKTHDVSSAVGKKVITQKLLPFIASLASRVEQDHWIGELALALRLKEELLYQELAGFKTRPGCGSEGNDTEPAKSLIANSVELLEPIEEHLLSLLMRDPALKKLISDSDRPFLSPAFQKIIDTVPEQAAQAHLPNEQAGSETMTTLTSVCAGEAAMKLEFAYLKSQELWRDKKSSDLEFELRTGLKRLKRRAALARLEALQYEIKTAERDKNRESLAVLTSEFAKISKQLAD